MRLNAISRRVSIAALALGSVSSSLAAASPLADAIEQQDYAAAGPLLDSGTDVNAPQVDGMTALHWAAYHDDATTAELLLKAGARPDAVNRYGIAPLYLACTNGNAAIVTMLLDAGAHPNATISGGETMLMTAARVGLTGPVQALLHRGAEIEAREHHGQTALMWAAAEGNVEVVNLLIAAGADVHATVGSGFDALFFAIREGKTKVVDALLAAGVDVNETIQPHQRVDGAPRSGTSVLLMAVANAHFELAARLLDAGADPRADLTGYTALHLISETRKPGLGDNNPAPEGSGNLSSIELVRHMVAQGADPNARMTKKAGIGNTSINTLGATPFFLAARSADVELMRTLVELGADPDLRNADNSTPLMAATGLGTRSPGEDSGREEEVLAAVHLLLELGADINAVDDQGETAMHGATYKNLPRVVALLAARGADIEIWNRKNKFGWTPLLIAEGYRHGNFKPSDVTIAAVTQLMDAAGVKPLDEPKPIPNNYADQ